MPPEPSVKRAVCFFDGQNLFHAAKDAFGYTFPNYDPLALAKWVCDSKGWELHEARFYTGVPEQSDDAFWNHFWTAKLGRMGHQGIVVFSRALRYRNQTVNIPGASPHTFLVGEEKGIDVRIALDVIRLALSSRYDVAIIFSQDQDLSEATTEVKMIASEQKRWIKLVSCFPMSPTRHNSRRRGIDRTDWIHIDRAAYDSCIDHRNYRPKR